MIDKAKFQNQFIAQAKLVNAEVAKSLVNATRAFENSTLLQGIDKTYKPFVEEDGEALPPEKTLLRQKVSTLLASVRAELTKQYDTMATIDFGNTIAKADVVVDDKIVLKQVPATTLLFLEKRLEELASFISRVPTLDPSETWNYDKNVDAYVSNPAETVRTVKVQEHHVIVPPTDKHPAHVVQETKDVRKGTWRTIKLSGAIPAKDKNEWLSRLHALQIAVKHAREEANRIAVGHQSIGDPLLSFVFGDGIV